MKKSYILLMTAALALASCNDFLEREPLDFGNQDSYYKTDNDLRITVNDFYKVLPQNNRLNGGLYTDDTNSDNQCTSEANELLYRGNKRTVKMDDASNQWNFKMLRGINSFITTTESLYDDITGNQTLKAHYLGEGYFFRAYEYFRLLRYFGDVPIITEVMPDNQADLTEASRRAPRNEVARFILADLDRAASLMVAEAPESGRVTRDAALALKARVALFEATWEKYHAGTCFVPGNAKWPGYQYHPGFTFKAGSAEAEYNFFFEQAIAAAQAAVADRPVLEPDYASMFINYTSTFPDNHEVILARYYQSGVVSHSCSAYLKSGGNNGFSRALVNSFLMTSGLPIYADANYQGDIDSYHEFMGRDQRLVKSVRACGNDVLNIHIGDDGKLTGDTVYYYLPFVAESGQSKSVTGYELLKWYCDDPQQSTQYYGTTAVPLFRTAECLLTYIEAWYERYGNLGGNCDTYWRALRSRAGVSTDYAATIAATDLSKENDLAVWSKGMAVDPTLYNIRRERRCEFIGEGQRIWDLKRWRALDMCNKRGMVTDPDAQGYQPEGMNLWDQAYLYYEDADKDLGQGTVSQQSISKYIRPLQALSSSNAYNGYDFPKPHYLEPIPISEFSLTVDASGASVMYQNPGWSASSDGIADYSFDCD